SVTQEGQIKPATTPGTPGHRAILIAPRPQQVAAGIQRFRGKWSAAYPRAVGFGDADHGVDRGRRDSGSDDRSARGGAGGSHEGVGAMVDVEHGALRAFEEDGLAVSQGLIEK